GSGFRWEAASRASSAGRRTSLAGQKILALTQRNVARIVTMRGTSCNATGNNAGTAQLTLLPAADPAVSSRRNGGRSMPASNDTGPAMSCRASLATNLVRAHLSGLTALSLAAGLLLSGSAAAQDELAAIDA